jgi:adenine-specific DNA-methyltransferase
MTVLDIATLGQVFTPKAIVDQMLSLRHNKGRTLEPSAGNGAFSSRIRNCVAIEIDPRVAQRGSIQGDFFAYPLSETFDTIIGNPPYVRYQDIKAETKKLLDCGLFDGRSNLYLFFIEKAVRHLRPGGELIFIVPRDFIKLTAARHLNEFLYAEGTITDFIETGDTRIFSDAVPNCAIFRFERGCTNRRMADGRIFSLIDGQLMFLADEIFKHPRGNAEFVCSETIDTGQTRRMFFGVKNAYLTKHKDKLLARRIRRFDETNWWQWGRIHHVSSAPRIYVNQKTRRAQPYFLHPCNNYDGSILAIFPKHARMDLRRAVHLLNSRVDWSELGFVCDGRFIFGQRTLQTCLLPEDFRELRAPRLVKD